MSIHAFKIDGDKLELNVPEILKYNLLAKIYTRDTSKEKEFAYKEFKYIYFLADKKGYVFASGLSEKDAHKYAIKNSGLNEDYKPDSLINKAIVFVREDMNITVVEDLINSNLKALNLSGKIVNLLVKRLEDTIEQYLDSVSYDEFDFDKAQEIINTLLKSTSIIPDRVEQLMKLKDTFDKSEKGVQIIRGGSEYVNSYDGDDEGELTDDISVEKLQ